MVDSGEQELAGLKLGSTRVDPTCVCSCHHNRALEEQEAIL